eukprot:385838_1
MASPSHKPLSTLLKLFGNENELVIDGFNDLEISQHLETLDIDKLSSHTKRDEMVELLAEDLPDLQGNINAFKRIRLKAVLSQQMQEAIKLWAQRTLKRAKIWLSPPCTRTQPHHPPYYAHIDENKDQSATAQDTCRDSLDLDRIGTILRGVYDGFECNELIRCFEKHKYMKQNFMDDLCDMVLGGEQNYAWFYQILYDEMNIMDAEKRQKIYYALLFEYIEPKQDLNKANVLKICMQWVWHIKSDDEDFDLMEYTTGHQTRTKSQLLASGLFPQWKSSDKLNIIMLDSAKDNKHDILPNTLTSPLDILCSVLGSDSLPKKLNHLDVATQCEYLKMDNMDTNQKRNQLISKVSRNIHTRIHLKHVLSKYYQYIAALSLYDVRLWTPHHLLLSFVYHCIAKAETDPKTWYFVARFSAHCLASTYDGNTLLTQMNEYEDKEDTIIGFGGNITKMIIVC